MLLTSKGIEFEEVDVLSDDEAFDYVVNGLGKRNVPVVVTPEGDVYSGIEEVREAFA